MSNFVFAWAWKVKGLTPTQRCVLMGLADYHTEAKGCFPSVTRLMADLNLSRATLFRTLKELEDLGLLSRKGQFREDGSRTSTLYILNYTSIERPSDPDEGFQYETTPVSNCDGGRLNVTPKLNNITNNNNSISGGVSKSKPPEKADNGFEEFWSAYPRKIGKSAAEKAYAKALKVKDRESLLRAASIFARQRSGKDAQFTPHPATWLNQGRWDDEEINKVQLAVDNLAKKGIMPSRNFV